uniref:Uncharacterized protein n=1 Tax=Romanomermis culicivorax TaxID=13658 RepID=A0A915JH28_ROMCU
MSAQATNQSDADGTFAPNNAIAAYPAEPPVAVRVTMASVLESMHKISLNSTTGLVRLHRIVKHLRRRKPQWNQWSSEPDLYKDQQLMR